MLHKSIIEPISRLLLLALILITACSCTDENRQQLGGGYPTGQRENGTDSDNRLDTIKKRGKLICGINDRLPGFSYKEADGSYSGISVDLCRAIAVVLFDDANKIEFRHLNSQKRFTAVESGEVDILSHNTTWTLSRDTSRGLDFPPTNFYDGQGLLVAEDSDINDLDNLNGRSICVLANTTSENNLGIQMRKKNLAYTPVIFEDVATMYRSYESRDCEVVTSDRSDLIARRTGLTNPGAHKVLDLVFSKEPLGPVIANGEPEWFDVVEWVFYATIKAEEMGINSQNVDRFTQTKNPAIRRFLGMEENLGANIGLSQDFTRKIIKSVGNYGEIYDRNIGEPFNLSRGENNLVKNGGLLHSPPFR